MGLRAGPADGVCRFDGIFLSRQGTGQVRLADGVGGARQFFDALSAQLQLQVGKIIEAGHLRPWLVLVNVPGSGWNARGDVDWDNPGEVLGCWPMQSRNCRMRCKHICGGISRPNAKPIRQTLATMPYTIGTAREVNPYDAKLLTQWQDNLMKWRTKAAPGVWNLYGLCRYYEVMGEKPSPEVMARCTELVQKQLENRDWATRACPFFRGKSKIGLRSIGLIRAGCVV